MKSIIMVMEPMEVEGFLGDGPDATPRIYIRPGFRDSQTGEMRYRTATGHTPAEARSLARMLIALADRLEKP